MKVFGACPTGHAPKTFKHSYARERPFICQTQLNKIMRTFPLCLALALSANLVALHAAPAKPKSAPTLVDVSGHSFALADAKSKATLLLFVAHDCPISNSYAPEINRLVNDYRAKKVRVFVVYAEGDLSLAEAKKHGRDFGFRAPLLLDSKFRLSHFVGAKVTPEAAVFSPSGKRLYLGRIDNRFLDFGKKRAHATQRDLRIALDAVLSNKAVPHPTTTAVGCFIPEETTQ